MAGAGPGGLFRRGPGGSAIGEIPSELPQLADLNQDRDLVFIDQRGTGGSNGLNCPSPPATLPDRTQVRRSIKSCLDSLRGWADLRFYTITMAAEEAAQVLSALHYGKVNIIGGSYRGTAAQVFQQQFPARVRTMTLQSGALLGIPLFEWFPRASQQALDSVFARCASDPVFHGAFPHLAAEWGELRASVAAKRPGPVSRAKRRRTSQPFADRGLRLCGRSSAGAELDGLDEQQEYGDDEVAAQGEHAELDGG